MRYLVALGPVMRLGMSVYQFNSELLFLPEWPNGTISVVIEDILFCYNVYWVLTFVVRLGYCTV